MDAVSYLPPPFYLLWCHSLVGGKKKNHAAVVAFAPFLLILLKSGPTDDETFLPFSGSLWKRFLIFKSRKKKKKKKKHHSSAHLRLRPRTDPHITYPEMKTKGTTTSKKKCHQHIIFVCNSRRMRWGSSRMWDLVSPCGPWRFFSPFTLTPAAKYNQHVGLFRLFSWAAWWRSSCLIHRWPWSTKCLAQRGKPRRSSHSHAIPEPL